MTQEWWFDSDGLIRKFSTDFGGADHRHDDVRLGRRTSTIEAPPSDEVTTMPGTDWS